MYLAVRAYERRVHGDTVKLPVWSDAFANHGLRFGTRAISTLSSISNLFLRRMPQNSSRMLARGRSWSMIQLIHILMQKLLLLSKELGWCLRSSWWDAKWWALERRGCHASKRAAKMRRVVVLAVILGLGHTLRVERRQRIRYSIVRIRRRALATRRCGILAGGRLCVQCFSDNEVHNNLFGFAKL